MIDPLGLRAGELRRRRAVARARRVDASRSTHPAALPDGTTFDGAGELRRALLEPADAFVTTLTEKLFTYASGRGLEYYDAPAVRQGRSRDAPPDDYRFSSLIVGIVRSLPFQMSRRPA